MPFHASFHFRVKILFLLLRKIFTLIILKELRFLCVQFSQLSTCEECIVYTSFIVVFLDWFQRSEEQPSESSGKPGHDERSNADAAGTSASPPDGQNAWDIKRIILRRFWEEKKGMLDWDLRTKQKTGKVAANRGGLGRTGLFRHFPVPIFFSLDPSARPSVSLLFLPVGCRLVNAVSR